MGGERGGPAPVSGWGKGARGWLPVITVSSDRLFVLICRMVFLLLSL